MAAAGISLMQSLKLIMVSILLGLIHPVLGILAMFIGSLIMMIGQYKKPWRLNILTALCPPILAFLSIVLQSLFLGLIDPLNYYYSLALLMVIALGGLLGLWRGVAHKLWRNDQGQVIAQRSTMYLWVWALCFMTTQTLAQLKLAGILPFAYLSNWFSVAMLSTVMLVLLIKHGTAKPQPSLTPGLREGAVS